MKKRKAVSIPLLILFLSICLSNALAKPVDTLVAKRVALNFMKTKAPVTTREATAAKLIYTGKYQDSRTSRTDNCFYIYSTSNGFVIVSADDRIEPILGYSTEGRLDLHGIPESMEEILDGYVQEIKIFLQQAAPESNAATEKWRQLADNTYMVHEKGAVVGPLIKTRWNQSSPYNLHCPDSNGQGQHALTGCVATAMAQILRYWEYPTQGTGSKSYICDNASSSNNFYGNYGRLTVDFSIGNYNYNYMPNVIDNSSPSNQINAVAKLSYHCGVSVQMTYGIYASEAATSQAVNALSSYFKYSTTYNTLTPEFKNKSSYSDETDWVNLIKSELNAWRPVIYSGSGSGGHAFICDGYDNQGYFHFNWGWGGYLDGYFLLTALTPTGHNYNYNQSAIIHIQGNTPLIRASADECSFISPVGGHSNSSTLSLCGVALSGNINASVPSGFQISTDDIHYGNTLTLGSGVSQIYVRYVPTLTTIGTETAVLSLSSGTTTKTIALTGRTYELDCNPPQNVQGTHDDGTAHLSWTAPTQTINTYPFSWDSTIANNYYPMSNWTVKAVHRMTEADLIGFHKKQLTQVSFFARSVGSSYKIVVFKGGSYVNGVISQGTQVVSQSVSSVRTNNWNTVTLSTPIDIDASEELWYGVQFTSSNTLLSVGSGTYVPDKGSLIYIEGYGWMIFKNLTANAAEVNFPLIAIFQDAPATITDYTIDRNDITIGSTTSTSYQDHITTTGTYTYNITANWSNGCSATSGDITMSIITDCTTSYGDTTATVCGPFTWHGVEYTETPVVAPTFTYQTSQGCDSIVTLHLTINHAVTANISATACENYTWNGQTYTQSGNYTQTFTAANGCDSVVTLHLTINHAVTASISATACENYTWNGQTYTQSGNYTQAFTAANGCDSVVTLHMTINHAVTASIYATACENYTWNGQTYTQSGNYTQTLTAANGCDSVVTLHLTINHAVASNISASACENYTWNGQTYTQSGNYTQTFTAANGCDSVVTLHLTINHAVTANISATACENYSWNEQTYTQSGNYTQTFTAANGCDSVVTLHLTINHAVTASISATACESYSWNGQTYTKSGTYTQTFTAANGCDSVVTLHLTINHAVTASISATACESYSWNGQTYTQSGNYTQTFTASNGCDSVVTLHLIINHAVTANISATACESYSWNGQTYTKSGHYTQTFTAANGCDSVVTLHLTINHGSFIPLSVAECGSYLWHDTMRTESGTYLFEYINNKGCPSTDTLHLVINNPVHTSTVEEAVETFVWLREGATDTTITTSGTYTHTHLDANGCAQTDTLHLTVYHATNTQINASACESFVWQRPLAGDTTLLTSGSYVDNLKDMHGADSVITLILNIKHGATSASSVAECDSYIWHDTTYTESGTYIFEYINNEGCPSSDTLHLVINHAVNTSTVEEAVETFVWHREGAADTTITTSGTYTHTHPDANGCAQTDTLHLTVYHATGTQIDTSACEEFIWQRPLAGDTTLLASGIYRDTLTDVHGADSVITLALNIKHGATSASSVAECDSYLWHDTTRTESGTYIFEYLNNEGCPSSDTLHLVINHAVNTSTVEEAVEAFTWLREGAADTTITMSGTYTHTHPDANGCAQTDTLHLTVYHATGTQIDTSACEEFIWQRPLAGDTTLLASGIYRDTLTDVHGADSVITLALNIKHGTISASSVAECDSYVWHDTTRTESGTYIFEYINNEGCPSSDTLHLVINHAVNTSTVEEAVEAFTWLREGAADSTITTSGTYTHTHPDDNGCAQTDTLYLTVYHATGSQIDTSACEEFIWQRPLAGDTTLLASGIYRDTLTDVHGADSVITLNLTINPSYYIPENVSVMEAQMPYLWHGQTFNENATAFDSLSTVAGCDSVFYLNLTVVPFNIVQDNPIALCQGETQLWRGHLLFELGIYSDTVPAENTIYTVEVIVNPTYNIQENMSVCESALPFTWHNQTVTGPGIYTDSSQTTFSCDSIHTLSVYVTNVTTQEDSMTVCGEDATYTWHNMTLSETGIYSDTLRNTNGCDSIVYTMNFVKGSPFFSEDSVHLSVVTLPYVWHGMAISDAGVYYDSLQTSVGCDSVYSLQAYYYDLLIVDTPITLCPGDTVFWRMRTITESGTYRDTVFRWGDRFIFSVVVTMGEPFYHNDTVTVCQDELPYIWHEQSFDTSGTSILRLQTVAGCDSIYMLTLTVNPSIRQNDTAETCQGTPYAWRGHQLESSGYYVDSVANTSGCEDVYTLLLTVIPTYSVDTTVTITTNELPYHFVSGQIDTTFEEGTPDSSTLNFHLSTIHGCDSIITLHLTILTGITHHPMEQTLRAFPNPTSSLLTVIGTADFNQIQLFDAYGRQIRTYSVEENQIEIDLHSLADGVYFIKAMRHKQMIGTLRIIKNGL